MAISSEPGSLPAVTVARTGFVDTANVNAADRESTKTPVGKPYRFFIFSLLGRYLSDYYISDTKS